MKNPAAVALGRMAKGRPKKLTQAAKAEGRDIKIFKNMNGETAAALL